MDLDPEKSLSSQKSGGSKAKAPAKVKKKKPVKRKKIYWDTVEDSKVNMDSIWGQITAEGDMTMDKLKFDLKEFEELFTDQGKPKEKKKSGGESKKEKDKKKVVTFIDGKRAMNGGIILARIKVGFNDVVKLVNQM